MDHFSRYTFVSTLESLSTEDIIKLIDSAAKKKNHKNTVLADQYTDKNSKKIKEHLKDKDIILVFRSLPRVEWSK